MTWILSNGWWISPNGERLRAIAGGQEGYGGFLDFSPADYAPEESFQGAEASPYAGVDFGQFDQGPMPVDFTEQPGFLGTNAPSPFAGGEENLAYDTSRGVVVDKVSGREVTPLERAGGAGVDITGRLRGLPGLAPPGQGGGIDRFLGTNLGRLLAAGGLGLAGLGAQRAVAGQPPRLNVPTYAPSAATLAGQGALLNAYTGGAGPSLTRAVAGAAGGQANLAEQVAARVGRETFAEGELAPGQRAVRNLAMGLLPGTVVPGQEQPFADPVQQAIRAELLGVLQGPGGVSPATARRQQQEEQILRGQLMQQLGRDYELTTAGIQALIHLKEPATAETYTERQATIARLSPLEEGRMRFAAGFPTEQLGARETIRRANVGQTAGLTDFGIRGTAENLNALRGIAPVSTLLGGNPDEANLINLNLANQGALESYRGRLQSQRDLAAGVGGVFGTVAGQVGQRPSRLEDLIASGYGLQRSPSDFRFF